MTIISPHLPSSAWMASPVSARRSVRLQSGRWQPASTSSRCIARTAISSTSSCRPSPTSAAMPMAAAATTACACHSKSSATSAPSGRRIGRCSYGSRRPTASTAAGPSTTPSPSRVELKELGVDAVDCSSGGFAGAALGIKPHYQVPHAAAVRRAAGIATMAVGLIFDPEAAEAIVATGEADLVALAREALNDPNWPLHAMKMLADSADPYAALAEAGRLRHSRPAPGFWSRWPNSSRATRNEKRPPPKRRPSRAREDARIGGPSAPPHHSVMTMLVLADPNAWTNS